MSRLFFCGAAIPLVVTDVMLQETTAKLRRKVEIAKRFRNFHLKKT